jgi:hypothetical protein
MWTPIVGRLLFAVENFLDLEFASRAMVVAGTGGAMVVTVAVGADAEAEAEYMVYTEAPDASMKELEEGVGRIASMFVERKPLPRAAGTDPVILKT